jgi:predicted dehydrogenase
VAALADLDRKRLEDAGRECGVANLYQDPLAMLRKESLDIVSVATPNKFHKPLTVAALQAGCHVLCEKPMALNAREAEEMLRAAKRARRRIMINFSFRFVPQSWALKQEVDTGILGDIYFGRTVWQRRWGIPGFGGWFGQKALAGGGPLIDLGVHRTDLALWLMGYPKPVWVLASTWGHLGRERARREGKKFDVEDLAVALVKFDNGAALEIEASWAGHIRERERMETHLLGTQGGLTQRNLEEGYKFEAEIYFTRNGRHYDMKLHEPAPPAPGAMQHFVDAILKKEPHTATGEEGWIVMRLLDAVYESSRTGRPVRLR